MSLQHPEVIRLDLPARYTYLHILSDCIADMLRQIDGIEDHEMLTYNMQLAAHEACTNIVGHAYAGTSLGNERIVIALSLLPQPRRLQIELRDTGKPFDPDMVPSPSLDQAQVHGYGLFLMRNLMDTVTYKSEPGDNYWCLVKNL
ncbi:MAG: ATP-binding protein [Oscillochloris sp.]|nr:ATP-binding protein [Oscillochloris sp.]